MVVSAVLRIDGGPRAQGPKRLGGLPPTTPSTVRTSYADLGRVAAAPSATERVGRSVRYAGAENFSAGGQYAGRPDPKGAEVRLGRGPKMGSYEEFLGYEVLEERHTRNIQLLEAIMSNIETLRTEVSALKTNLQDAVNRIQEDFNFLKTKIAAGEAVDAELASLTTQIADVNTALRGIDPVPDNPVTPVPVPPINS